MQVPIEVEISDGIFMCSKGGEYTHPSGKRCEILIAMNGSPMIELPDGRKAVFQLKDLIYAATLAEAGIDPVAVLHGVVHELLGRIEGTDLETLEVRERARAALEVTA